MFGKYLSIKKTDTLWHYDLRSEDGDRSTAHLADEDALIPICVLKMRAKTREAS
jgi:hypothetical protein